MFEPNYRMRDESQEHYCFRCVFQEACNVILNDNETCLDRIEDSSIPEANAVDFYTYGVRD